ncbi:hypothetical protein A0J61_00667 [Choanephora cucurbitarum]|uniref:GATA-type domain-containing protein n=1 Tax=Choanephora cucurbitarum TaxID=101091 RepID=A0A1C7NQ70_9FUNG|nr:hypothetical protein A0J61_00667 [Choanephora cucurbitarum]
MSSCVWALLSIGPLNFVYASHYQERLHGHSLWDYIHPEEISLAKRDLSNFINSNKLGGSVTRCRLRDFTTHTTLYPTWLIMDVVMYVATKDLVLVFLHPTNQSTCYYRQSQMCLTDLKEALNRNLNQNLPSPSLSTSSSLSSGSQSSLYPPVHDLFQLPRQCLSILDSTKSTVFAWPGDGSEMPSLDDISLYSTGAYSCFRSTQPCSRLNAAGERAERLVIEHGPITFLLVKISPSQQQPKKRIDQPVYRPTSFRHCCQSCGTDSSPEWRRGPTGHKT